MSNPQKLQVQPLEPVQHGVGSIRRQIFTRHCRPGYVPFSLAHHVPSVPADDVVDLGRAHMIVPSAQIKPEFLAPQQVPAFTPHRPVQPKRCDDAPHGQPVVCPLEGAALRATFFHHLWTQAARGGVARFALSSGPLRYLPGRGARRCSLSGLATLRELRIPPSLLRLSHTHLHKLRISRNLLHRWSARCCLRVEMKL